jgi:hydroxymethylbilane synthase
MTAPSRTVDAPRTGPLRLGTRGSTLALAQARAVSDRLADLGASVELVEVTTHGDASPQAVAELGGTGVFVSALRERLLSGATDLAVHSLKDLPTADAPGLVVAAIPVREDPRDVVVAAGGRTLAELPAGARVGTGSPRRAAQLRALGLDLEVVAIRGNVDTRVRSVASGDIEAVVVARAGLARLGRLDLVTEVLGPDVMLPAPGQGALAVECRAHDSILLDLLGALDDASTRSCVIAERTVLAELRAGCTAPVGALATIFRGPDDVPVLGLDAVVAADPAAASTAVTVRTSATGSPSAPEELGRRVAAELLASGATAILGERQ